MSTSIYLLPAQVLKNLGGFVAISRLWRFQAILVDAFVVFFCVKETTHESHSTPPKSLRQEETEEEVREADRGLRCRINLFKAVPLEEIYVPF